MTTKPIDQTKLKSCRFVYIKFIILKNLLHILNSELFFHKKQSTCILWHCHQSCKNLAQFILLSTAPVQVSFSLISWIPSVRVGHRNRTIFPVPVQFFPPRSHKQLFPKFILNITFIQNKTTYFFLFCKKGSHKIHSRTSCKISTTPQK